MKTLLLSDSIGLVVTSFQETGCDVGLCARPDWPMICLEEARAR